MNDYQPQAISIDDLSPFERFAINLLVVRPVPLLPPARIERIKARHAVLKATWARLEEECASVDDTERDE